MNLWKEYTIVHSVSDAVRILYSSKGKARLIAGGTDLLLDMQQGRIDGIDILVDISEIDELNKIEIRGDFIYIGAAAPISRVISSNMVAEQAEALSEACKLIGGAQVRNRATLGGNVAHALPAGDGSIALLALGAEAEVEHAVRGRDRRPIGELYKGPGKTALHKDLECLVGFYLPVRAHGMASAFLRIMRPQGVALPLINMGCWMKRDGKFIEDVRIAVGPAGGTPQRAYQTETVLSGNKLNTSTINLALDIFREEMKYRTSPHRASAGYRQHLGGVLLKKILPLAWDRAALID